MKILRKLKKDQQNTCKHVSSLYFDIVTGVHFVDCPRRRSQSIVNDGDSTRPFVAFEIDVSSFAAHQLRKLLFQALEFLFAVLRTTTSKRKRKWLILMFIHGHEFAILSLEKLVKLICISIINYLIKIITFVNSLHLYPITTAI